MAADEMVARHKPLSGHESEQTPGEVKYREIWCATVHEVSNSRTHPIRKSPKVQWCGSTAKSKPYQDLNPYSSPKAYKYWEITNRIVLHLRREKKLNTKYPRPVIISKCALKLHLGKKQKPKTKNLDTFSVLL